MDILLIAQVFPPQTGGSGRWLWELYRRLEGASVRVVADHAPGAEDFDAAASLPIQRVPLRFDNWGILHARSARQYVRAFRVLRRLVAQHRPDAVHCGKCLPEGLLGWALKRMYRIPYVCYVHGEELTLARTSRELRRLTALVLAGADRIVANSGFTRQLLVESWSVPIAHVTVMHPGVDSNCFVPAPHDESLRAQLGWTGRRVVLTVGALQARKGQDTVIRALPVVRRHCPDVLYAIVGEGWERAVLEQLATDLGVGDLVQFRGTPTDTELVSCYQQCDLFVLAAREIGWDVEGFGMVLVEAQACGKPVLAGRSGGTADTLVDGRTGHLVDPTSPDMLATAVVDMLDDPGTRAAMGRRARAWAVEQFDWVACTRRARALFAPGTAPVSTAHEVHVA